MPEDEQTELSNVPMETTLSEQFEILKEMDISVNSFEKSAVFSDKVTVGLNQAISDAFFSVEEIEDAHKSILKLPEVQGLEKSRNIFYKLYNERGEVVRQLKLANAYRMWWVKFMKEDTKKMYDLLKRLREEYDAVAKLKAERDFFEVKSKKESEFISDYVDEVEEKHKLEVKMLKDMLADANKEKTRLLDIISGQYKSGGRAQAHEDTSLSDDSEGDYEQTENSDVTTEKTSSGLAKERYTKEEIKADKSKQAEIVIEEVNSGERSREKLEELIGLTNHPLAKMKLNRLMKMLKYENKIDEKVELVEG